VAESALQITPVGIAAFLLVLVLLAVGRVERFLIFAVLALPLGTMAVVNVWVDPVFGIGLNQFAFMALFGYLLLWHLLQRKRYPPVPGGPMKAWLLFLLWIPVSWAALLSSRLETAVAFRGQYLYVPVSFSAQNVTKALYVLFALLVFVTTYKAVSLCDYRRVGRVFALSGAAMAFFGLAEFVYSDGVVWLREILVSNASMGKGASQVLVMHFGVHRVYGLMWEPGGLAEYLLAVFFFLLAIVAGGSRVFGKTTDLLLLGLLGLTIALTRSTAILGALLVWPVLVSVSAVWAGKGRRVLRIWGVGLSAGVVVLVLLFAVNLAFELELGAFFSQTMEKFGLTARPGIPVGGSAAYRWGGTLQAVELFRQSPVIGLGLGSVGGESTMHGGTLAFLLANVGLVGTAFYLSILVLVFKKALELLRAKPGDPNFSVRLGFLWAFIWVVAINLAARGMAGLHSTHMWFLAAACIALSCTNLRRSAVQADRALL